MADTFELMSIFDFATIHSRRGLHDTNIMLIVLMQCIKKLTSKVTYVPRSNSSIFYRQVLEFTSATQQRRTDLYRHYYNDIT